MLPCNIKNVTPINSDKNLVKLIDYSSLGMNCNQLTWSFKTFNLIFLKKEL